jgi:fatty-acyl-CoA synthase
MTDTLGSALLAAAKSEHSVGFWSGKGDPVEHRYSALAERACDVAAGLRRAGVQQGDRVALVLSTSPQFYHAFFGCIFAGAVPCAMYPPVRLGRIEEWKQRTADQLRAVQAVAVLTEPRLRPLLGEPVAAAAPPLGCRLVDHVACAVASFTPTTQHADDLAAIQFSSGSTGAPKPVALTHANIIGNARSIISQLPGNLEDHSGFSWLPLYHDMGLVGCLVVAVLAPGSLTLLAPERFVAKPQLWLEGLARSGATISVAPNFAYALAVERTPKEVVDRLDLSRWSVALCGAEPVQKRTLDAFAEHFAGAGFNPVALTPVYGLSEVTLAVAFGAIDRPATGASFCRNALGEGRAVERRDGLYIPSVGKALPGHEVRIQCTGRDSAEAVVGNVLVRGVGVMAGYFDRPDATADVLREGWLDTGDLGFFWGGELYLCGRSKDIIIVRGRNVDPADIESVVDTVAGVRRGCVAAVPVEDFEAGTEAVGILLEARQYRPGLIDDVRRAVRAQVRLDPLFVKVLEKGSLPRTSSGKIRRQEALKRWQMDELDAPDRVHVAGILGASAKGIFAHWRADRARRRSQ